MLYINIRTMFMQYENYKFCLFGHLFVFQEYLKTIFVLKTYKYLWLVKEISEGYSFILTWG